MSNGLPDSFSDERAKAILARAIELDTHASMTSLDDLHAIAADLDVSSASLDAALREESVAFRDRRLTRTQRAATGIAAAGLPLGTITGALLTTGEPFAYLAALGMAGVGLAASGALLMVQGGLGTLRRFHFRNAILWSGYAAGSLAAIAVLQPGMFAPLFISIGWCVRSWAASSILGSAAVVAVNRVRATRTDDGPAEPTPGAPTVWHRVKTRVAGWFHGTGIHRNMTALLHNFNVQLTSRSVTAK